MDIKIIRKFDILCGTPFHFQGSERDIILISFTVDNDIHHSAYRHLNQPEVLNVGTSRAKSQQFIFTSVDKKLLDPNSLLGKYLEFVETYQYQSQLNNIEIDMFQQEVSVFLHDNLHIKDIALGYNFAGKVLDIFFQHKDQNYFVDLIGHPGQFMNAAPMERYKTLARVGINILPLHNRFWRKKKAEAEEQLTLFIKK